MKKLVSVMLCCISIFLLIGCGNGAESKKEISLEYFSLDNLENVHENIYLSKDERYTQLCQNVLQEVERKALPGSLIIANDQQILFASGTDILQTDGKMVSPYTTYQIGSVSKLFTSACVLKLIEEGKLSPDDKMEKFFPEYENIKGVSVDNLLHMNSGIADFVNYPEKAFPELAEKFVEDAKAVSLDEEKMHEYMKTVALEFEPGTKTEYSNTNYYLLGSIIEKTTGKSYNEYVNEVIIEPLGLKETKCGDIASVTCAYDASMIMPRFDTNPPLIKGSGDISTNVLDLLQFDRALFVDDILGADARKTMFDSPEDYSCGWMKDDASSVLHFGGNYWQSTDEDTIYHQGRIPGFWATNIVMNAHGERVYVIFLMGIDENTGIDQNVSQRIGAVLKYI